MVVNPDRRPLPPGWSECYDKKKDRWYYIQDNVVPVRVSITHPCNENSGAFIVERIGTTDSSISPGTNPSPVTLVNDERQTPIERTSATDSSISTATSPVSPVNSKQQTPSSPPSTSLTPAQRLYASALPAKYTSNPRTPSSETSETSGNSESSRNENTTSPTRPSSSDDGKLLIPTTVSMASVSAEAYGRKNSRLDDSSPPGGSFYKSSIVQQFPQNRPLSGRPSSSTHIGSHVPSSSNLFHGSAVHGAPHRTQSLQATRPFSPSSSTAPPHRVSSYSAGVSSHSRPHSFTKLTETPNITLVARPPPSPNTGSSYHQQQISYTAAVPSSTASLSRPNASPQSQSPALTLSPISPANNSSGFTGAGFVHTSPPSSPPAQTGHVIQASTSPPVNIQSSNLASVNAILPSMNPSQTTGAASHRPLVQQGASQQAIIGASAGAVVSQAGSLPTDGAVNSVAGTILSQLGRAAGRAALRYVGRAVVGSVLGQNPNLLSGLASGLFDNPLLDTLNNSLANFDVNAAGIDLTQFQAAFQGVPGTDYQGIIDLMSQQQQTAPSPGVNYHAIISALVKIQHAMQAHSQATGHHPGSSAAAHAAGTGGQVLQLAQHLLANNQNGAATVNHVMNSNPQLQYPHQPMIQQPGHSQQSHVVTSHQQSYPQQPASNLQLPHQQTHVQPSQPSQPVLNQQSHVQPSHQSPQQPVLHSQQPLYQPTSYSQQLHQQSHVQPHLQSSSHQQSQLQQQTSPSSSQHPALHSQQPHQQLYVQPHPQSNFQQPGPIHQTAPYVQQPHQSVPSQSPQHQVFSSTAGGSTPSHFPSSAVSPAHPSSASPPQYSEMGGTAVSVHPHSAPAQLGSSSSMSSAITSLSHHFMNMMHEHHGTSGEQDQNAASSPPPPSDVAAGNGVGGGDNEQPPEFSSVDYNNPAVFDENTGMNLVVDPSGMLIGTVGPSGFVDVGGFGGSGFVGETVNVEAFVSNGSGGNMFVQTNTVDVTGFTDDSGFMTDTTVVDSGTFVDGLGVFSESVDTMSCFTGDGFFPNATDQVTFAT